MNASVCVRVCVCERERERDRESKVMRVEREGRKPCSNTQRACKCQISSAEWRYGTFEHPPETEEAHTGKPKRHRLFTEVLRTVNSGGVGKRNFFLFSIFKKKRKVKKKKSRIPPKSGRLTSLDIIIQCSIASSLNTGFYL